MATIEEVHGTLSGKHLRILRALNEHHAQTLPTLVDSVVRSQTWERSDRPHLPELPRPPHDEVRRMVSELADRGYAVIHPAQQLHPDEAARAWLRGEVRRPERFQGTRNGEALAALDRDRIRARQDEYRRRRARQFQAAR